MALHTLAPLTPTKLGDVADTGDLLGFQDFGDPEEVVNQGWGQTLVHDGTAKTRKDKNNKTSLYKEVK